MTLTEVTVALSIFAVFATSACRVLVSHRKIIDRARHHYTAANIAKNRYELARTVDFEQVPELNEQAITVDLSGIPSLQGHYNRTTTVNSLRANLYELVVTVKIRNRESGAFDGAEQTITGYIAHHL
jgi:type II secretory pathway pseudopilin PulG